MTVTSTITKHVEKREATLGDMAVTMYEQWRVQGNKESTHKNVEDEWHETALADVNENGAKCYGCGSPHHKRNQCPHRKKSGRNVNKGG